MGRDLLMGIFECIMGAFGVCSLQAEFVNYLGEYLTLFNFSLELVSGLSSLLFRFNYF